MRVITGRFRGRRLRSVDDLSVRPATDRVKKTLFDMLATRLDLEGAAVLDLFAGSGSLGFEALSRGADHAVFVERDRRAALTIEQNATALGCLASTAIHETDAMVFLHAARGTFDLIFADPPYAFGPTADIPGLVFHGGMLKPEGYLLIEHDADREFPASAAYRTGPVKKFGRTLVTFFRHPSP